MVSLRIRVDNSAIRYGRIKKHAGVGELRASARAECSKTALKLLQRTLGESRLWYFAISPVDSFHRSRKRATLKKNKHKNCWEHPVPLISLNKILSISRPPSQRFETFFFGTICKELEAKLQALSRVSSANLCWVCVGTRSAGRCVCRTGLTVTVDRV